MDISALYDEIQKKLFEPLSTPLTAKNESIIVVGKGGAWASVLLVVVVAWRVNSPGWVPSLPSMIGAYFLGLSWVRQIGTILLCILGLAVLRELKLKYYGMLELVLSFLLAWGAFENLQENRDAAAWLAFGGALYATVDGVENLMEGIRRDFKPSPTSKRLSGRRMRPPVWLLIFFFTLAVAYYYMTKPPFPLPPFGSLGQDDLYYIRLSGSKRMTQTKIPVLMYERFARAEISSIPARLSKPPFLPATGMSVDDAAHYCAKFAGHLPTQKDYETATQEMRDSGERVDAIGRVASTGPNKLGLYDLNDGVWEWTSDKSGDGSVVFGGIDSNRPLFESATAFPGTERIGFRCVLESGISAPPKNAAQVH